MCSHLWCAMKPGRDQAWENDYILPYFLYVQNSTGSVMMGTRQKDDRMQASTRPTLGRHSLVCDAVSGFTAFKSLRFWISNDACVPARAACIKPWNLKPYWIQP